MLVAVLRGSYNMALVLRTFRIIGFPGLDFYEDLTTWL